MIITINVKIVFKIKTVRTVWIDWLIHRTNYKAVNTWCKVCWYIKEKY